MTMKSARKGPDDVFIAGRKTINAWKAFRPTLIPGGDPKPWEKAAKDYFEARLLSRYLSPIKTLQQSGSKRGEGFSIVAVQCSLIEFLETTIQGKSYRYRRDGDPPLGQYEYSNSRSVFESFLLNRTPFDGEFNAQRLAHDFYVSVRCGLLHEARTKNGWTILAKSKTGQLIDANMKIVYRDDFQSGLLTFVKWYKGELPSTRDVQEAFLRKFDSLCLWKYPESGGKIRVTIADNGSGIMPQDLEKIFSGRFTTKGAKGNGVGLWIAKRLVEDLGGSIRVRSNVNLGRSWTCFSVFLPVRHPKQQYEVPQAAA